MCLSLSCQNIQVRQFKLPTIGEFGEMTLSDHDPNENADYELSEPEDSDDELEFNSDASVSEDSEVEEELVEEDAKNQ